jgi:imidazolonepropionase-like amidohydrolase
MDEMVAAARPRLDEMLACGTTTCEVKSGYGLDTESELKQLRAIRALDAAHAIDLSATFDSARVPFPPGCLRIARHRRDDSSRRGRRAGRMVRRFL